ncbi:MAG: KH domain-containing protein [Elusimicrobia bacterium]|nr:KH domain-containing protein [Elusimicrobiota bacterium]
MADLKELVTLLAKSLVEHPDQVEVRSEEGSGGAKNLLIKVADDDKGKIIGKQGKVIKAVRAVVGAAASKSGEKALVDLE